MPNIEMHGLNEGDLRDMYDQLVSRFRGANYASEVVITGVRSAVRDLSNEFQPFLRIYLTTDGLTACLSDMKERLADIELDIEIIPLLEFIPKKP